MSVKLNRLRRTVHNFWWIPVDPARNWPDLGSRFEWSERQGRAKVMNTRLQEAAATAAGTTTTGGIKIPPPKPATVRPEQISLDQDSIDDDVVDLSWATVLKRTFESYVRGERPNMVRDLIMPTPLPGPS